MTLPPMYKMKKIEVILEGGHLPFLQDLMIRSGITGYTVVRDVAGLGHAGPHAGRMTFNDIQGYMMAIAVGPEMQIAPIVEGLKPFFREHPGVVFVSDTAVLRRDHFDDVGA